MKGCGFAIALAIVLASGCTTGAQGPSQTKTTPVMMDESVPQVARDACLREVRRTTNNPELTVIEMVYSEANSQLKVGVGPNRAPWQCTVSNSGIVASVMSLTDEGAL